MARSPRSLCLGAPGMGLRKKALLIAAGVAVLLCAVLLFVSHLILYASYERLETTFALQDLERVRHALDVRLEAMGRTARDWAAWNAT